MNSVNSWRLGRALECFSRLVIAAKEGWVGEQMTCEAVLKSMGIRVEIDGQELGKKRRPRYRGEEARRQAGLVTKQELADLAGVGPETIDRWRRKGILEAIRPGKTVLYFDRDEAMKRLALTRGRKKEEGTAGRN
jgi:hypothetical protein